MDFQFKSVGINLPETKTNHFDGIKVDQVPVHRALCVETRMWDHIAREIVTANVEENDAAIIHIEPDGQVLMNFRAATGALPEQIGNRHWVDAQTKRCEDAVTGHDNITLSDIIDALVFIALDEEKGGLHVHVNSDKLRKGNTCPPYFFYRLQDDEETQVLCEALKNSGFLFIRESENVDDDIIYNTIVNPNHIKGICYHEDGMHGFDLTMHGENFFGANHSREELIKMLGEERYYDLAYFHEWDTMKQIPLRGLSDEYLRAPPEKPAQSDQDDPQALARALALVLDSN